MLPGSHFTAAFHDTKCKHFSNARSDSSLCTISCIRQPVAEELDKIYVLYVRKFCRPTSLSVSQCNVATQLRLNLRWCTAEACKYKKRNHNGRHDGFLVSCNIGCKNHTADDTALTAPRFSHSFVQENFTSKWWFRSRVEARNFTKNKLFKTQRK